MPGLKRMLNPVRGIVRSVNKSVNKGVNKVITIGKQIEPKRGFRNNIPSLRNFPRAYKTVKSGMKAYIKGKNYLQKRMGRIDTRGDVRHIRDRTPPNKYPGKPSIPVSSRRRKGNWYKTKYENKSRLYF